MATATAKYFISAIDQTKGAINSAKQNLGELGNKAKSISLSSIAAFTGVTLSLKGLYETVKSGFQSFVEAEKSTIRLAVSVKNNPLLNGQSLKNLKAFAQEMSDYTKNTITASMTTQQEAFLAAQGRTEDQIRDVIKAAIDLTAITSGPLDGAVKQLSKTYSGMAGELGESIPALRSLTKEQLQNGEAIKLIQKAYEGAGKAIGSSGGGVVGAMNKARESIEKNIGKAMAPLIAFGAEQITPILNKIGTWFSNNQVQIINFFLHLPQVAALGFSGLLSMLKELFTGGEMVKILTGLTQLLVSAFKTAISVIPTLLITALKSIPSILGIILQNIMDATKPLEMKVKLTQKEFEQMQKEGKLGQYKEQFGYYQKDTGQTYKIKHYNKNKYGSDVGDWTGTYDVLPVMETVYGKISSAYEEYIKKFDEENAVAESVYANATDTLKKNGDELTASIKKTFIDNAKEAQVGLEKIGEGFKDLMNSDTAIEFKNQLAILLSQDLPPEIKKYLTNSLEQVAMDISSRYKGMGGYAGGIQGTGGVKPGPSTMNTETQSGGGDIWSQIFDFIKELFGNLIDTIKNYLIEAFQPVIDKLLTALQPVIEVIQSIVSETIDILMPVMGVLSTIFKLVAGIVQNLFNALKPLLLGIVTLVKALQPLIVAILSIVNVIVQSLYPVFFLIGKLLEFISPILQVFGFIVGTIANGFIAIYNGIAWLLNTLLGWAGVNMAYASYIDLSQMDAAQNVSTNSNSEIETGTTGASATYSGGQTINIAGIYITNNGLMADGSMDQVALQIKHAIDDVLELA